MNDPLSDPGAARRSFGIVFQDPSLDDELTARENMDFHGMLYGVPAAVRKARIEELLKFVELWERRDDRVKHFSGGMKRRLEIARGLLHGPPIRVSVPGLHRNRPLRPPRSVKATSLPGASRARPRTFAGSAFPPPFWRKAAANPSAAERVRRPTAGLGGGAGQGVGVRRPEVDDGRAEVVPGVAAGAMDGMAENDAGPKLPSTPTPLSPATSGDQGA
jgi:hypothetical protein